MFAGMVPRCVSGGIGGFVFFGAFECARAWLNRWSE
jgi:hypothetical protein